MTLVGTTNKNMEKYLGLECAFEYYGTVLFINVNDEIIKTSTVVIIEVKENIIEVNTKNSIYTFIK